MEEDYNIFIDPAFVDIEAVCKDEIHKYLDGLPNDVKDEMLLRPFRPRIPVTRGEVLNMIENWTNLYKVSTAEEEEGLKTELVGLARSAGVEIDGSLRGKDYQKSLRLALENMSDNHLLKVGVFGYEITLEDIEKTREMIVSIYLMHIKQAAYVEALEDIGKQSKREALIDYKAIAYEFPQLIKLIKDNVVRRNLLN